MLPHASIVWLVCITVTDLGDGVIARKLGVDTNLRHMVDAVVDRITIHATATLVVFLMPETFWLVLPVIIRDILLIIRNVWLFRYKHVIITPGYVHRFGTALYGVLCATVLFGVNSTTIFISGLISVAVWLLLIDYLRAGKLAPSHAHKPEIARYQARQLSALRGITPNIESVSEL